MFSRVEGLAKQWARPFFWLTRKPYPRHANGVRVHRYILPAILAGLVAGPFTLPGVSLADADPAVSAEPLNARIQATPNGSLRLLARTCPTNGIRYSDLEAGRIVNGKLAMEKAIRKSTRKRGREVPYGTRDELTGKYIFARTPKQVARAVRRGLGGDHFLARSMDALAALTNVTTQVPLDGVNVVTGKIIEHGGRALRIEHVPHLKLKSRITANNAGVSLGTRW